MRKLILFMLLIIQLYGFDEINVTVTKVSSECKKISRQSFQYYQWAGGCPFYSKAQALSFLRKYDITQTSLPSCLEPQNINPPLGETFSQPIPKGYYLIEESTISSTQTSYLGYGKGSSDSGLPSAGTAGVTPTTSGIRTNTSITSGGCSGLSAHVNFVSDVYNGIITKETFNRIYRTNCSERNKDFPKLAQNEQVLFEWAEESSDSDIFHQKCQRIENAKRQISKLSCKLYNRCVKKLSICNIVNEQISSYVSPKERTFHEDIALDGVTFGLHYNSSEANVTSIAKGWFLSNDAKLIDNRVYYGNGIILIADKIEKENNMTVQFNSNISNITI